MKVIVYSTSWCCDCRDAKKFLDKHNIRYTDLDIDYDEEAEQTLLENVGRRAIPRFVIDGEWVQPYVPGKGFQTAEMKKRLGIKGGLGGFFSALFGSKGETN